MMEQGMIATSDYLQKQCEYLRGRLSASIDETSTVERNAIALTGGIWAWLSTHQVAAPGVLRWLPLVLTLFLGLRSAALYARIQSIRAYLRQLESAASVPVDLRWFVEREALGGRWRQVTAVAFWAGLTVVNVGIAILSQPISATA